MSNKSTSSVATMGVAPAGRIEVGAVDGEHERIVEDGRVEPVGHDQFQPVRPSVGVGALLPLVDPREAVQPTIDAKMDTPFARPSKKGDAGISKIATIPGVGTGTVQDQGRTFRLQGHLLCRSQATEMMPQRMRSTARTDLGAGMLPPSQPGENVWKLASMNDERE